jgi:Phosphoglucomutase/phosphomannomutase, alpha/beta/alpha domain I
MTICLFLARPSVGWHRSALPSAPRSISQAICQYRSRNGIDGPLFIGIDTHALSQPALASAIEVFAANDVEVMIDVRDGYTPTTTTFEQPARIPWCPNSRTASRYASGLPT